MRTILLTGITGLVLCSAAGAMAQIQQQQQYYAPSEPVYVPSTAGQSYYPTAPGVVPFYNNSGRPLPIEQMVAGKNAPSYTYSGQRPYNFGATNSGGQALSPSDVQQMRAARDARAQQYQNEYMQQLANQQVPGASQAQQALNSASNYYSSMTQPEPQQKPKKKRLVSRADSDPLQAPPRLFNLD